MERWESFQRQKGNIAGAEMAKVLRDQFGDVPLPSVATPEISLEIEWNRQAQNLAGFFAKELKFKTPEGYITTLPKFEPQPENWKGRLDTPVIVETRIRPERQAQLVGMYYFLIEGTKTDWNKEIKNYLIPNAPYAAWLEDGRNNRNRRPKDVRRNLKPDEIAGTELDGIALYISNPKILGYHFLDLPGTSIGSDHTAMLTVSSGKTVMSHSSTEEATPFFGSVIRGRQK